MSLKPVANEGLTISHKSGSSISGGAFSITSVPDPKISAEGAGVFFSELQFTFSGGSAMGFVAESVKTADPATIPTTAAKVKNQSGFVMREGDFVAMACVGTIPPPTGGTGPVSGPVEISDAGQTTVGAQ